MQRVRPVLRRARVAAFALAAAALFTACPHETERGHQSRGVLLIAIDSLRADHLSSMGYDRATTPVIDGLAKQGALFRQTFGVAPEYLPAHAGLLTGCDPWIFRRPRPEGQPDTGLTGEWWMPATVPNLAFEYLSAGYATAAFVDHPWISPTFGFDRGFQDFYRFREDEVEGYADYGFEGVVLRFRRWRRALPEGRDWFAYLSLTDLDRSWTSENVGPLEREADFAPRPEYDWVPPLSANPLSYFAIPDDGRGIGDEGLETLAEYELRYDRTIRLLDKRLGRMLQELGIEGRLEGTTICIVGSFGVGFGESGLILDTGTLSDVDMHVPWILRPASGTNVRRGVESDRLASLLDVAPTLLELSNLDVPPGMHGRSHLGTLRGEDAPVRDRAYARGGLQQGFAVRDERYSLEHTATGARGPAYLRLSWEGYLDGAAPGFDTFVRDRLTSPDPGNLGPGVQDLEYERDLLDDGRQWYQWIQQAAEVVHETPWTREPVSNEVIAELVENGIIAPPE